MLGLSALAGAQAVAFALKHSFLSAVRSRIYQIVGSEDMLRPLALARAQALAFAWQPLLESFTLHKVWHWS